MKLPSGAAEGSPRPYLGDLSCSTGVVSWGVGTGALARGCCLGPAGLAPHGTCPPRELGPKGFAGRATCVLVSASETLVVKR